jgi:hypothetical protein
MEEKSDQKRSPRYPAISLGDAIAAARSIWAREKRTAIQGAVLAKALGYNSVSGPVRTRAASLGQYGLIEKHGGGLRLSDLAMRIIHSPENSPDYKQAVQEAALSPELFRELHASHADASDDAIRSYLILRKGFSDAGARLAAAAYRDNLSLAQANHSVYNGKDDNGDEGKPDPKVGDYVQWESQGVLQFSPPRRVRALAEDAEWAFVDGSATGIPVKELTVVEPPAMPRDTKKANPVSPPPVLVEEVGLRRDVFSLPEGTVIIEWPASLSTDSYDDIKDWLEILKRKIGRSVVKPEADKAGPVTTYSA